MCNFGRKDGLLVLGLGRGDLFELLFRGGNIPPFRPTGVEGDDGGGLRRPRIGLFTAMIMMYGWLL